MESRRLLILGSGFSKSIFSEMLTVEELSQRLRQLKDLPKDPYNKLLDDPELLLSYLSLEQPWKDPAEALEDKAMFVRVQKFLAQVMEDREDAAFKHEIPDWAKQLVEYLHESRTPVITFNYDTVLERIVHKLGQEEERLEGRWPREYDLYNLPLSSIFLREAGVVGAESTETFHLIKLHGSINWFYSGVEGFPGEQVYLRPIDSDSPYTDNIDPSGYGTSKSEILRLLKDKVPLIIPPVAEKSRFYSNQTVRSLWRDARKALEDADEIFCIGYSLPQTDLTTKLLLQSVTNPNKVFIVNRSAPELKEHYQKVFPKAEIVADFKGEQAVEEMTKYLTKGKDQGN